MNGHLGFSYVGLLKPSAKLFTAIPLTKRIGMAIMCVS